MSYRIVWRRGAMEDIHTYSFLAFEMGGDPAAFERAIDDIKRQLESDPLTAGESRGDGERVVVVPPLTVTYEVFEADRVVLVYKAHVHPHR